MGVDSRRTSADPHPAWRLEVRPGLGIGARVKTASKEVRNGRYGPAAETCDKRRRRTKPASYGAADPVTASAADDVVRELGLDDPHPLVTLMWTAVQESCESRFYSEADWGRLRGAVVRERGNVQ